MKPMLRSLHPHPQMVSTLGTDGAEKDLAMATGLPLELVPCLSLHSISFSQTQLSYGVVSFTIHTRRRRGLSTNFVSCCPPCHISKTRALNEDGGGDFASIEDIDIASLPPSEQERVGSDLQVLLRRFWQVAIPYWSSEDKLQARLRLAGVFALTLATTGISVGFNFLGRDFYNALASKDQDAFTRQLLYYLGAFAGGIPVFVFRDYFKDVLSLRWRTWMTNQYLERFLKDRTYYYIQSESLVDNPDQRIVDDLNAFTGNALGFGLALINAAIDLISFSGILYGIYPPLFGVLVVYALGGTAISVGLGKGLVNLNFLQEKREADFRYGLVRIRENVESIAFYEGESNEMQLLLQRFKLTFDNYTQLLIASRNLEFFQSGYRYLIQLLPAAVVAPLYFSGKIEFGVINQSFSAFNHILNDFSIIIFQFQSLSSFSAVIDRLGEFSDVLDAQTNQGASGSSLESGNNSGQSRGSFISLVDIGTPSISGNDQRRVCLLQIENLTLKTPRGMTTLVEDLSLTFHEGEHLLIMGSSGTGKTSLLRAIAGLWRSGSGIIRRYLREIGNNNNGSILQSEENLTKYLEGKEIFFLPQRPYMVLGSLREQLLYPTWSVNKGDSENSANAAMQYIPGMWAESKSVDQSRSQPTDIKLIEILERVQLSHLTSQLDSRVAWSNVLSLGEQQRIAFARLLLSSPRLVLLDEATSALDEKSETLLYKEVQAMDSSIISVGHRSSLKQFHTHLLRLYEQSDNSNRNWVIEPLIPYPEEKPTYF